MFLSVPSTCKHLLELTKHLKEGLQTLVEMTKHLPCNDETLVEMTKHLGIPLPATGNVNALGYIKIHPLIRLTAAPEILLLGRNSVLRRAPTKGSVKPSVAGPRGHVRGGHCDSGPEVCDFGLVVCECAGVESPA